MNTDPGVDAYIEKAPLFAQPILKEVRARLRKGCPSATETIKWNVPFYVLGGQLLASMAAFKKHAKVGLWSAGKGSFVDVVSVAELPPAKDFLRTLETNAKLAAAPGATPTKKTTTASAQAARVAPRSAKKPAVGARPARQPAKKSNKRSLGAGKITK